MQALSIRQPAAEGRGLEGIEWRVESRGRENRACHFCLSSRGMNPFDWLTAGRLMILGWERDF